MQSESTGGFTASIKAGYDLVIAVDDLTLGVDLEAGQRVVKDGRRPCGMERRFLNFVHWSRLSELGIFSRVDVRVVLVHGLFQHVSWNWPQLIWVFDFSRQLRNRVRAEEPAIRIDVRRLGIPLFAHDGIRVKDRPYRATAIRFSVAAQIAVRSKTSGKERI